MQTRSIIQLVDNVYTAEVALDTNGLTPVEKDVITKYGEPTISCGGEFTDGVDLTYTLATNDKKFPSQFPVKQSFSRVDYPDDAYDRADLWIETLKTKIDTAVTALRAIPETLVGTTVSNIDTQPA